MFAVTTRYRFRIPPTEETLYRVQTDVLEGVFRQTPGFRAYYGVQVTDREALAISLWDNQGAADDALRRAAPHVQRILGGEMSGNPERTMGEVVMELTA